MKKGLFLLTLIVFSWYLYGVASAFLLEKNSEKYMKSVLPLISKPWSDLELSKNSSWWMKNKAPLKTADIARLSQNDLGNFMKFITLPDCNLQQGYDKFSNTKHTYSICTTESQFEKKSAILKIRLIRESADWKINDFISIN